ncbi:MAG TPA: T9SS type A sorting domain-containing protein, partial [Salinivirgaceae bacterium]|nr:T9SS type A sorting domain-containing protein [Salinivirgaceae bacterium]
KGDGMNRIVVMNTSNVFTIPTNLTDYVANSAWGNSGEQVVFNGSGNSVIITNLSKETQYFFRVFAYNDESQYSIFNTSTAFKNPNSVSISLPPTTQDYDITFSNVTATSATINWTRVNGTHSLVCMNVAENYLAPEGFNVYTTNTVWQNSGAQWVYSGDQTSVEVTGLTLGTTYYFVVYAFNNSDYPIYCTSSATDNPFSIQLGGLNTWNGNISENWNDAKNWSLKHIPFSGNDVTIPEVTNHPVLSQNASVKKMTITSKGRLTVKEGGIVLSVNGNLHLGGDTTSSGSLVVRGNSNVNVTGQSYLVRYYGPVRCPHYSSFPNKNRSLAQFVGCSMYKYDEPNGTYKRLIHANGDTAEHMLGYYITVGTTYNNANFSGAFNNGPHSIVVTNTNYADGWNLLANPYPSAIDWGNSLGWSRENIQSTVYMYDGVSGTDITYNYETGVGVPEGTTGIIPSCNGFFIMVDSTVNSTTLEINNNARVHSYKPYVKNDENSSEKILRLSIVNEFATSETAILFHPKALNEINFDIDAFVPPFFPEEERLKVFSIRGPNNTKMMLSSVNENLLNTLEPNHFIDVPIGFVNNRGLSSKLILNKNSISDGFDVYLYNKKTDKYHNLEYPYSLLGEDENSYNTFSIRVMPKVVGIATNIPNKFETDIFAVKDVINIKSHEPITGSVIVYDVTGRLVYYEKLNGVHSHKIKNNNKSGIFVVVINSKQGYYSQKLFVE